MRALACPFTSFHPAGARGAPPTFRPVPGRRRSARLAWSAPSGPRRLRGVLKHLTPPLLISGRERFRHIWNKRTEGRPSSWACRLKGAGLTPLRVWPGEWPDLGTAPCRTPAAHLIPLRLILLVPKKLRPPKSWWQVSAVNTGVASRWGPRPAVCTGSGGQSWGLCCLALKLMFLQLHSPRNGRPNAGS